MRLRMKENTDEGIAIEKDYSKVFPATLFECFDEKSPMHFIFSLKKEYKNMEEILKILKHCGAQTSFNKSDVTVYSAIIADHNEVVNFYGPAFTIEYITDCLKFGKQQDICKYRQKATKHLVEDSICMQVVYYRKFGWNKVLKKKDKHWIDSHFEVEFLMDNTRNVSDDSESNDGSSETWMEEDSDEERKLDRVADDSCKMSIPMQRIVPNEEDDNKEMNIRKSTILSKSDDTSNSRKLEKQTAERGNTLASANTDHSPGKRRNKDVQQDGCANSFISCKIVSSTSQDVNLRQTNPEWTSKVERVQQDGCNTKRSRKPYTKEEQCQILKYIVEYDEYSRIKGCELWTIMERKKVCPSRTWQSMKEHFFKKIMLNLDGFNFLTKEQRRRLNRAFY